VGNGLVAGGGSTVWDGVSPAAGVGRPGVGEEEVDGLQARAAAGSSIARKASPSLNADSPRGEHRRPVAGDREPESLPPTGSHGAF